MKKSGHIGGSLSSCEIMTVLFHKCMKHALGGKNTSDYEIRDRYCDDSKSIGSSTSRQLGLNLEKRNSKDDYFITKDYSKMKKTFGFDSINEPQD